MTSGADLDTVGVSLVLSVDNIGDRVGMMKCLCLPSRSQPLTPGICHLVPSHALSYGAYNVQALLESTMSRGLVILAHSWAAMASYV